MRPEDVINLDSYPIADPDNPALARLIAQLSKDLTDNQYCSLPGFIRPQALERAVSDAQAARPQAHDNNARRNCYLHREGDPALAAGHPRNIMNDTSTRMIAYDLLPEDSPLKALYHWDATRKFIAAIVGEDELYDNADPFQPVNVLCAETGDQSAWHFDSSNAFTMTLMLQAPGAGGEFELVPNTRSDTDENYDYVQDVLTGKRIDDAVGVAREPGSLCIFRGCNSLHRVTRVESDPMRIMAVFVYEREPGVVGDPRVNANIYGPRAVAS
ncbi:MAG: hypothetical protein OER56_03565 [Hyphomicrobiales bacterium]|nr:hypothetical protein [Hyphomicrobiales bacterium]